MRRTSIAAAVGIVLVPITVLVSPAQAASPLIVGVAPCAFGTPDHTTIGSAVTDASSGDTIEVCPGTYAENVNDGGKDLTFIGAQNNVDPRGGRSGSESTVDGATGTAFTLTGQSTVTGFTIIGASLGEVTPGVALNGGHGQVAYTVFDQDNAAAIITGPNHDDFTHNAVTAPSTGGVGFFYNSGAGTDSSVLDNSFTGNFSTPNSGAAINVADPDHAHIANALIIDGNTADTTAGGNFAVLGGTSHLVLNHNQVTGSANSGTGILLLGDDSDFSMADNTVTGIAGASALSINDSGFGYQPNGSGEIDQNSLRNNLRGINNFSDTGTITARSNILVGNSEVGAQSVAVTSSLNAANNWWGCNGGPGAPGCDKAAGNTIVTGPWLVLSSTIGTHSLTLGQHTLFRLNLNRNSNGGAAPMPVLAGDPATFAFTRGTMSPPSDATKSDGTVSSTATATATGAGVVRGTIDNQTVQQNVNVVKSAVTIHDATTYEGDSGTHPLVFAVTLNRASGVPITVRYTTANGSAQAPGDFVATSGTLTIPAGATHRTISVLIRGDHTHEPSETLAVTIFSPTNATIADANGSGVIRNDD